MRLLKGIRRVWFLFAVIFAVSLCKSAYCQEEVSPEDFTGEVTSRTTNQIAVKVHPGKEFADKTKFYVYEEGEKVVVAGKVVSAAWTRIGKISILRFQNGLGEGVIIEEYSGRAIEVGNRVGIIPNTAPKISGFKTEIEKVEPRHSTVVSVDVEDMEGDALDYEWTAEEGIFLAGRSREWTNKWTAPYKPGTYKLAVKVSDGKGGTAESELQVVVTDVQEGAKYRLAGRFCGRKGSELQFKEVTSSASDSNRNIYVLDSSEGVLKKFDVNGWFQSSFSGGSKDLSFSKPERLILDNNGNFYVIDAGRKFAYKFDPKGNHAVTWGNYDTGGGKFIQPSDMALGTDGTLYVVDSLEQEVKAFENDGRFLLRFGTKGERDGEFLEPVAVDSDREGFIYVLDSGRNCVQVFNRGCHFIRKFSCAGSRQVVDMAIDSRLECIYVLDGVNGEFMAYELDGTKKFEKPVEIPGIEKRGSAPSVLSISVDGEGNVLVAGGQSGSVLKFDSAGKYQAKFKNEDFSKPKNIVIGAGDEIYLLDGGPCEVSVFDVNGWVRMKFGGKERDVDGKFYSPEDVSVDSTGNVYVIDGAKYSVQKFSREGKVLMKFGSKGDSQGSFKKPVSVAQDAEGNSYVLDSGKYTVEKFDADGKFALSFGHRSKGRGQTGFKEPVALTVDNTGVVHVLDEGIPTVHRFGSDGRELTGYGKKGDVNGEFGKVQDIEADSVGFVYVLDTKKACVHKFKNDGSFVMDVALEDNSNDPIKSVADLSVDAYGAIYVLNEKDDTVYKFMQ